ncbi:hypothetical protein EVAR_62702_1 [Eumeta japonica]|uniref:Uncharacterized protein n=1 Tax=Eumeta variegata TaxID=151549 RepID=A0A4C1ZKP0_EUMVA|nr:hypothetical protein EVAR_62702_1 [Eumeta japonica]
MSYSSQLARVSSPECMESGDTFLGADFCFARQPRTAANATRSKTHRRRAWSPRYLTSAHSGAPTFSRNMFDAVFLRDY